MTDNVTFLIPTQIVQFALVFTVKANKLNLSGVEYFSLSFTGLSVFLSLFPPLKVLDYLQKKFAELGSPNKMKVSMGHGAKAWVSDFNHPHYIAGRKAMTTGTGTMTAAFKRTQKGCLSMFITMSPCPCWVPQFLVWNRIWHVRAAAFQSPWPSRRPQDATSCCFLWGHLTMELTPRMKRSTGMLSLTGFSFLFLRFEFFV